MLFNSLEFAGFFPIVCALYFLLPHRARLPLADLMLDTFPCNGHTTSSDALWAGVPVLPTRLFSRRL